MIAAEGILTATGGVSSHAALVARQMGKVCVCGAAALQIDYAAKTVTAGGQTFNEGDFLSINGTIGAVYAGQLPTAPSEIVQVLVDKSLDGKKSETYTMFKTLMDWCSKSTRLQVRTNADTPEQTENAIAFGATGIGLCRTEHMFFDAERIAAVREMILSEELEGRQKALAKILPMQRGDFTGIFREMKGLPVTIRLLDPPLHEFLPQEEKDIEDLARTMGVSVQAIKHKVDFLHEFNPMLGHRGCRLGITYPEIYDMQVRAIMEAACGLVKNEGYQIVPEIMIPLIATVKELAVLKKNAVAICEEVMAEQGVTVEYLIGTMIELPRAALTADEIAVEAEFFSYGTNDLTQTTFGLSRDDAGKFLPFYVDAGILPEDPFVSLDQEGVGLLVKMGCEKGRATRPDIKLGICGEHGGDPASVIFCHNVGLDYVSCSPFRVPIARLAAAHAALGGGFDSTK
jgi:pyruvate,orthophosphate dikinase